ncbi:hypothetical protein ABPG77_007902 [Micractinium sp. CCAP 211/92]
MPPQLSPDKMDVGDRYKWVKEIGKGAYGVAVLMIDKHTGQQVAVKFIERGKLVDKNVEREILNHRRLSAHRNVVKFLEVFLTSTHLGIAMEYANGGTLFDRVLRFSRFKEDIARYFFQQLVCGVSWCHSRGVCHRDLKLENTLLAGQPMPDVKICDFGYSKNTETDSTPKTTVGTPAYVAPEVLTRGTVALLQYDGEKADVWSCGVALYTMLVGGYPFQDPADPRSCRKTRILAVQYSIPPQLNLSDSCVDLLRRIFVPDPAQRISLAQIRQHPWFQAYLPREFQSIEASLDCSPPTQTEAEIAAIVRAAREPGEALVEPAVQGPVENGSGSGSGMGISGEIGMERDLADRLGDMDALEQMDEEIMEG